MSKVVFASSQTPKKSRRERYSGYHKRSNSYLETLEEVSWLESMPIIAEQRSSVDLTTNNATTQLNEFTASTLKAKVARAQDPSAKPALNYVKRKKAFGDHSANDAPWWKRFGRVCSRLARKVRRTKHDIRRLDAHQVITVN